MSAATQRMPLNHLALVARGACIPGSHGSVAIEEIVLERLSSPGHFADRRLRHNAQYFCEGGLFACLGASARGSCFMSGTHLVDYRAVLKEWRL